MAEPPEMPFKGFDLTESMRLASDVSAQMAARQAELDQQMEDMGRAVRMEKDAKIGRENKGLELQANLLDQQRALVEAQRTMLEAQRQLLEEQQRQGEEALVDRRIQYAVLWIAVLGLPTTVVTAVAVASESVWWSAFAFGGTAAVLTLFAFIFLVDRKKRQQPNT